MTGFFPQNMDIRAEAAFRISASAILDSAQQSALLTGLPHLTDADCAALVHALKNEPALLLRAVQVERSPVEFLTLTTELTAVLAQSDASLRRDEEEVAHGREVATLVALEADIANS